MAKYRKKPVTIEAIELRWDNWNEICNIIGDKFKDGFEGCFIDKEGNASSEGLSYSPIGLRIPTLGGIKLGKQGDYIIKEVSGEFYLCKPDIFEKTYEPVIE